MLHSMIFLASSWGKAGNDNRKYCKQWAIDGLSNFKEKLVISLFYDYPGNSGAKLHLLSIGNERLRSLISSQAVTLAESTEIKDAKAGTNLSLFLFFLDCL